MTKVTIHNVLTGQIVEREANEQELANMALVYANIETQARFDADREVAKQAVLTKLGLSADELASLLGA